MTRTKTGWIPPEQRTKDAKRLTDEVHEVMGSLNVLNTTTVEIPQKQIFAEYELKFNNNKLLPRIWQKTGSCVGCGGEVAYAKTRLADIVFRQDSEALKVGFPFAPYGIGRRKAGMKRIGEGSFGAAQAWACDAANFGYLPWDHPKVPPPQVQGEWWSWSPSVEKGWSHPNNWSRLGVNERELTQDAKTFGIGTVTRIRNIDEADKAIALGFPMTCASMFGTRDRVEGDICLGRKNDSWAHQMSIPPTIWNHPQHSWIYQIDNQWGPNAHRKCPTLNKYGVTGSFWILRKDFEWIIRTGEVYAHSNTNNFDGNGPVSTWEMGIVFEDGSTL